MAFPLFVVVIDVIVREAYSGPQARATGESALADGLLFRIRNIQNSQFFATLYAQTECWVS
jgi:hypothetical protein